jgi:hypothetical protein
MKLPVMTVLSSEMDLAEVVGIFEGLSQDGGLAATC